MPLDLKLEHTFYNLQKDIPYLISVAASNFAGRGEFKKAIFKTSLTGKMFL